MLLADQVVEISSSTLCALARKDGLSGTEDSIFKRFVAFVFEGIEYGRFSASTHWRKAWCAFIEAKRAPKIRHPKWNVTKHSVTFSRKSGNVMQRDIVEIVGFVAPAFCGPAVPRNFQMLLF